MANGDRILFKLVEPVGIEVPGDAATLLAEAQGPLDQVLSAFGLPSPELLLADLDFDEVQAAVDQARLDNPGQEDEVPNPLLCFAVDVDPSGPFSPSQLAELVRDLPVVEWAQVDGIADAAVDPSDDPASVLQSYLNPAPVGVGAEAAWAQPGGDGAGISVGVVEPNHFDDAHRDLPITLNALTPPPSSLVVAAEEHATAVLGLIAAADNDLDCIGVAPSSAIVFAAGGNPAGTIRESELFLLQHRVGLQLGRGDVLNISIAARDDAGTGTFPLDFRPAHRTASRLLTFRGTTVVQAVGNGTFATPCAGINLDTALPAGLVPSNSPAIVVGGVQSAGPLGTFTRYPCSNFGARVDCCAQAQNVLTLTVMATDASGVPTRTVAALDGTSFAAAIIAGVVATIQGIRRARGNAPLTPAELKAMFKDPALATDPAPGQRVGRMPDLAAIVPLL
jgi:hypothetical protein